MTIELFFDGVIIMLVVVMIVYSATLNRKLKKFRSAQIEMSEMVSQLNRVVDVTQNTIADLKISANEEKENLENLLKKARALSDELSLMTEAGENLASRIEYGLMEATGRDDNDEEDEGGEKKNTNLKEKDEKKSNILKKLRNIR